LSNRFNKKTTFYLPFVSIMLWQAKPRFDGAEISIFGGGYKIE
jgi:hypothetical protein